MLTFPLRIDQKGRHVRLSFPDLPGAVLVAESRADALASALALLESRLQDHVDQGRPIPEPKVRTGQLMISTSRFSRSGRLPDPTAPDGY